MNHLNVCSLRAMAFWFCFSKIQWWYSWWTFMPRISFASITTGDRRLFLHHLSNKSHPWYSLKGNLSKNLELSRHATISIVTSFGNVGRVCWSRTSDFLSQVGLMFRQPGPYLEDRPGQCTTTPSDPQASCQACPNWLMPDWHHPLPYSAIADLHVPNNYNTKNFLSQTCYRGCGWLLRSTS